MFPIYGKTSSAGLTVLVDKDMAQEYMINDEADDSGGNKQTSGKIMRHGVEVAKNDYQKAHCVTSCMHCHDISPYCSATGEVSKCIS